MAMERYHRGRKGNYMSKIKVIIADDHELFREGTRNLIEQEKDLEVVGNVHKRKQTIYFHLNGVYCIYTGINF